MVFMERKVFLKVQYTSIYIVFFGRKILIKRQYVSTHIVFLENIDQNVLGFNRDCFFRKCWSKGNGIQSILSLFEILIKRQFFLKKFWLKDTMLQPILSFDKKFLKRKYNWSYIVMLDWKSLIKKQYGEPILSLLNILNKTQYVTIHFVF